MSQFIYKDNDGDTVTVDTKDSLSVEQLKLELHELKAQLLEVLREERNKMLDTLDKRYVHCLDHGLDVAPVLAEKAVLKDITEPLKAVEVAPGTPVTVEAIEELHEAAAVMPIISNQIQQLQITPESDTDAPMLYMPEAMAGEGVIHPASDTVASDVVLPVVVEEVPAEVVEEVVTEEPVIVAADETPVVAEPVATEEAQTVSTEDTSIPSDASGEAREEAQGPILEEAVPMEAQPEVTTTEAPTVTVEVVDTSSIADEVLEAELVVVEEEPQVAVTEEAVIEPAVEVEATEVLPVVETTPAVIDYVVEAGTDVNPDYPLEAGLPVVEETVELPTEVVVDTAVESDPVVSDEVIEPAVEVDAVVEEGTV